MGVDGHRAVLLLFCVQRPDCSALLRGPPTSDTRLCGGLARRPLPTGLETQCHMAARESPQKGSGGLQVQSLLNRTRLRDVGTSGTIAG